MTLPRFLQWAYTLKRLPSNSLNSFQKIHVAMDVTNRGQSIEEHLLLILWSFSIAHP